MELTSLLNQFIQDALHLLETEGIPIEAACERSWTLTLVPLVELHRLPEEERVILGIMRKLQRSSGREAISKSEVARAISLDKGIDDKLRDISDTTLWRRFRSLENKRLIRKSGKNWSPLLDPLPSVAAA